MGKLDFNSPPKRSHKKTFIYDHRMTMDPCLHPILFHHHGQFLSHGPEGGPEPQRDMVPEFGFCSTLLHHNIRMPSLYGWVEDIHPRAHDPGWEDRIDDRLVWRGSNTGIWHSPHTPWRHSHRNFLVEVANTLNGTTEVLFPTGSEGERVGRPRMMRNARVNPAVMDVAFAGSPLACAEETCPLLEEMFTWKEYQTIQEAGRYKYVLDVSH